MLQTFRLFRKYVGSYRLLEASMLSHCRKTNSLFYSSNDSSHLDEEKLPNLYRHLYSKIVACGPITVADFMKEVLTHPNAGYYMNKDMFGEKGDFTTSPEITQLFGEIIAVWMYHEKTKITNCPFQIIELGPGRGTLMKDILRVFKQFRVLNNVSIHLVEVSPILSMIQAKNLCKTSIEHDIRIKNSEQDCITYYREGITEDNVNIYWYYSIEDVPKKFSIFLAHEFFDALPIHKFQKTDRGWNEVLVDIIENSNEEKFRYVLSNIQTPATVYIPDNEKRDHIEVSPQSLVLVDYMAQYLWECGGFALICDYGHSGDKTDTFRAFCRHKAYNPLLNPGIADLTADVDFAAIKRIAEKDDRLITFGPVPQACFLRCLGIDVRLKKLLRNASKDAHEQLESGYQTIMDEDKMGKRFKILSLFPSILKEYFQEFPVTGFFNK